jgi:hypothetical protein
MSRRRRLRRRLLWAGVLLGLVLLAAVGSTVRGWFWARDVIVAGMRPHRPSLRGRANGRKGESMYGKFSITAVLAALAVALAAPAAWADSWAADRHARAEQAQSATTEQATVVPYLSQGQGVDESQFSGAAQATEQATVVPYLSHGQGVDVSQFGGTAPVSATSSYPDWFERFVAAHSTREPVGDDHFRDPPDTAPVTATSGTQFEWPQLGIGLAIVILIAATALLAVRLTRIRPLAR